MISLKSAFKHSFHDNGNMYKRQTLSMKKEKRSVNRRHGDRSACQAACGVIGFWSVAMPIDLPRHSGPLTRPASHQSRLLVTPLSCASPVSCPAPSVCKLFPAVPRSACSCWFMLRYGWIHFYCSLAANSLGLLSRWPFLRLHRAEAAALEVLIVISVPASIICRFTAVRERRGMDCLFVASVV